MKNIKKITPLALSLLIRVLTCSVMLGTLTACMHFERSPAEQAQDMPAALKERLKIFYPAYIAWVNGVQQEYAQQGTPLNGDDLIWAHYLGITYIDKVRIVRTQRLPLPDQAFLADELQRNGWGEAEVSRSMGYTIFIKPQHDTLENRARELAMIHQMEQMGYNTFLRRQIQEQRMYLDKEAQPLEIHATRLVRCLPNAKSELSTLCHVAGIKPNFMPSPLPKKGTPVLIPVADNTNKQTYNQANLTMPAVVAPIPAMSTRPTKAGYKTSVVKPLETTKKSHASIRNFEPKAELKTEPKEFKETKAEKNTYAPPVSRAPIKKVDINDLGGIVEKNEKVIKVYDVQ